MKWDKDKASRLRAAGATYVTLAAMFGTTTTTVRCWLDPYYAAMRQERVNHLRRIRCGHHEQKVLPIINRLGERKVPDEILAARLAEIPADTRNLTQRICGDPLPGRSALYKRQSRIG